MLVGGILASFLPRDSCTFKGYSFLSWQKLGAAVMRTSCMWYGKEDGHVGWADSYDVKRREGWK